MKVVLLCGGVGRRMFPFTEDKFLLKFLGRTLLEYQVDWIKSAGIREFVIIANPQNIAKIQEIIGKISDIKVELAIQREPLGMGNALFSAQQFLHGEGIIVNPNDVVEPEAYSLIIKECGRSQGLAYLLASEVKEYFPGGYLIQNSKGELERIVEKPPPGQEPSNLVNIVIHLFTDLTKLLEKLPQRANPEEAYELAIQGLVNEGKQVKVVKYSGFWQAIKYPWHIFPIVEHFLNKESARKGASTKISPKATIQGKAIIEEGVRVMENAVIRGPCYIGKGCVIGNNALIRDYSHLGEGCVVGFNTEVKHSYIGDGCWFHSNYIGDSIIAPGCSFGAGTITANWRFDEENIFINIDGKPLDTKRDKLGVIMGEDCKTGINVSLMPGVRIGARSIIGSHVSVNQDVEPDSLLSLPTDYKVKAKSMSISLEKRQKLKRRQEELRCAE